MNNEFFIHYYLELQKNDIKRDDGASSEWGTQVKFKCSRTACFIFFFATGTSEYFQNGQFCVEKYNTVKIGATIKFLFLFESL